MDGAMRTQKWRNSMEKRASLLILVPGFVKRNFGHSRKSAEKGGINSSPTTMAADTCHLKSYNSCDKSHFPQFAETPLMWFQTGSPVHSKKGMSAIIGKIIVLSFISIFILVAVLGSSHANYSSELSPGVHYKSYRKLQEEISIDRTNGSTFDLQNLHSKGLTVCPKNMENYVPCYNTNFTAGGRDGEEYVRHCDLLGLKDCLVPPPKEYRIPLQWPLSRTYVYSGNIKYKKDHIPAKRMRFARLIQEEGNVLTFGMHNEETYFQLIGSIISLKNGSTLNETGIHRVLDIGCRFGDFVDYLMLQGYSVFCIAPYEVSNSQVQLALERGLPAMIGSLLTMKLPYPSSSFDMIHCAHCEIEWDKKDGLLLFEIDRLLSPGGLFVWTPLVTIHEKLVLGTFSELSWKNINEAAIQLCWESFLPKNSVFIWKKPADRTCQVTRGSNMATQPCQAMGIHLYESLERCLVPIGGELLLPLKPELFPSSFGFLVEELADDLGIWPVTLRSYWSLITPLIFSDHPKRPTEDEPLPPPSMLRNVMDMNALYGGFNIAFRQAEKSAWVMNVVPTNVPNTLPLVYQRGLIGTLHNWCEAFPTYPRTYDFLHGVGILSIVKEGNQCRLLDLLLEMDRILRPEGWVLIRDNTDLVEEARIAVSQIRWDTRVVEIEGDRGLSLLVCQKSFWKS